MNKGGTPANLKPPWSSTNQPANRGRRKRLFKNLKDNGLTIDDIKNLSKLLLDMSLDELRAAVKGDVPEDIKQMFDGRVPAAFNILATALIGDMSRRNLQNFEQLLSRLYGRPMQPIEGEINEIKTIVINEAGMTEPGA